MLKDAFGETAIMKVLDFFLDYPKYDYSKVEIAEKARISYMTLHRIWPTLDKLGFLKKTRVVGKSEMWKLNLDDAVVKKLAAFDKALTNRLVEEELHKQRQIATVAARN